MNRYSACPKTVYLVTGAADDGGEHSARCVIAGEASFHQAGAVVAHQGGGLVVVAHDVSCATQDGDGGVKRQTKSLLVWIIRFLLSLDRPIAAIDFS